MMYLGASENVTVLVSVVVAFVVRLLSIWRGWSLPVFDYQEREYKRDPKMRLWRMFRK